MISHYSGYFSSMTNWPNVELTVDDIIRLSGESNEVFMMVHHYFEHRRFTNFLDHALKFDQIIDLVAFGANHDMPLIQNAAVDTFARRVKSYQFLPDRWSVEYLWERTIRGSTLRVLLVDLVRAMWIPDRHREAVWNQLAGGESPTPDQLMEMIEGLETSHLPIRASWQTMARFRSCAWHVHNDGERRQGNEEFMMGAGLRAHEHEYAMDAPELQRGGRGPHRGLGLQDMD